MAIGHWLIKSEPSAYPYAQLERDGETDWTGVRNFEARNNLRAMRPGDLALYYHSTEGKEIFGVAEVASAARADPTAPDEDWAAVRMRARAALAHPVTLAAIRKDARLRDFPLLTRSRLSVAPVSAAQFARVLALGKTRLPRK